MSLWNVPRNAIRSVAGRLAPAGSRRRRYLRPAARAVVLFREGGLRLVWGRTTAWAGRHARRWWPGDGYQQWIAHTEPTAAELEAQRQATEARSDRLRITLAISAAGGSPADLAATVESVLSQTSPHWELLVSVPDDATSRRRLSPTLERDARIRFVSVPAGRSAGSDYQRLLDASRGDFFALIDGGDRLAPHALFEVVRALDDDPDCDLVYSDEDSLGRKGRRRRPFLKPDWSPETMLGFNYIGRLAVVRRSVLETIGGFRPEYEDAQEWDLLLRVTERTQRIRHVPKCLYHRRSRSLPERRTALSARTARLEREALAAHLRRRGLQASVSTMPNGVHRATWPIPDPPRVSIIIPSRNKPELIRQSVNGLLHKTDYPRKEIIIVDNGSTDPAVLRFYEELEQRGDARIVPFNREFNYSAACNAGARAATGDLLLFLNNDIEVLEPDWLTELVRWALQPGVGVVGTKLIYPNGVLQHAGVVIGLHMVGLIYNRSPERWGVFGTPNTYRNYLAIMGACQMVSRKVFDEIGGFDEQYRIANSDVALCLQAWRAGYRTIYTPYGCLKHHEGHTRGRTNPPEDLVRTAQELAELGLTTDPCYHPGLSAAFSTPTLRTPGEPPPAVVLQRQIEEFLDPHGTSVPLDVYDAQQLRERLGAEAAAFLLGDSKSTDDTPPEWRVVQSIVDPLRRSAELRRRFPSALSQGAEGAYARWLTSNAHASRPSAPIEADAFQNAFRKRPGDRIRQIYRFRPDLQQLFPLAFLPSGRTRFIRWLATAGQTEYQIRPEEIWWLLLECDENPARELARTYLMNPDWQQRFPDALTAAGWRAFLAWFRDRFRINADWAKQLRLDAAETDLRRARGSSPAASAQPGCSEMSLGLNILGHFCYPSGLQESARSIAESLRRVGVGVSCRNVPVDLQTDGPEDLEHLGQELYDVSLIHVQPEPYFDVAYSRAGLAARRGVYRVGLWYWEFESPPAEWRRYASALHELWAPTRFIGQGLERLMPLTVRYMLPGVELTPFEPLPRAQLGLPEDGFVFLFMFDMRSIMERKNPLGLIRAFKKAFGDDRRVALVIKTSRGNFHPAAYATLVREARSAGVTLIDRTMSRAESYALIQACDCYVSLHRSEGLGLTMAEAMLMGKPVIATGYSGNMDFMDESSACLVDSSLVSLKHDIPPYKKGLVWAEPSVEHAAYWMKWIASHPEEARALGARGQEHARRVLSLESAGRRIRQRLEEIDELRRTMPLPDRTPEGATPGAPTAEAPHTPAAGAWTRLRAHARHHGLAATGRRIVARSLAAAKRRNGV